MKTVIKQSGYTLTIQPLNEKISEVINKLEKLSPSDYANEAVIKSALSEMALIDRAISKAKRSI